MGMRESEREREREREREDRGLFWKDNLYNPFPNTPCSERSKFKEAADDN